MQNAVTCFSHSTLNAKSIIYKWIVWIANNMQHRPVCSQNGELISMFICLERFICQINGKVIPKQEEHKIINTNLLRLSLCARFSIHAASHFYLNQLQWWAHDLSVDRDHRNSAAWWKIDIVSRHLDPCVLHFEFIFFSLARKFAYSIWIFDQKSKPHCHRNIIFNRRCRSDLKRWHATLEREEPTHFIRIGEIPTSGHRALRECHWKRLTTKYTDII